jgi:hypothetical protein
MNKKQLQAFKGEVEQVISQREALGDFDANSRYMVFLLKNMRSLVEHAIQTYPSARSSTVERAPYKRRVVGSNPAGRTKK